MEIEEPLVCRLLGFVREMVGRFVEVCRRRGKSKVTVLGVEEGMECEVCVDGMQLENVSELFGRIWYR